jgi:hypothetical protein
VLSVPAHGANEPRPVPHLCTGIGGALVEHQSGEFAGVFVGRQIGIMGPPDLVVAVAEVNHVVPDCGWGRRLGQAAAWGAPFPFSRGGAHLLEACVSLSRDVQGTVTVRAEHLWAANICWGIGAQLGQRPGNQRARSFWLSAVSSYLELTPINFRYSKNDGEEGHGFRWTLRIFGRWLSDAAICCGSQFGRR